MRNDALGVELHALDVREAPVAHAHDRAVLRPGGDLEVGGHAVLVDDEAVVARRLEGAAFVW